MGELKGAKEFVWVQEEPRNQGAWGHLRKRIERVLLGVVGQIEKELGYRRRKLWCLGFSSCMSYSRRQLLILFLRSCEVGGAVR